MLPRSASRIYHLAMSKLKPNLSKMTESSPELNIFSALPSFKFADEQVRNAPPLLLTSDLQVANTPHCIEKPTLTSQTKNPEVNSAFDFIAKKPSRLECQSVSFEFQNSAPDLTNGT